MASGPRPGAGAALCRIAWRAVGAYPGLPAHRAYPYDRPHDTRTVERGRRVQSPGRRAQRGGCVTVLDEILTGVREDVAARQERVPLAAVKEAAAAAPPPMDAFAALRAPGVGVIA